MAVIETWLRQDLKGLVTVRPLQGQVFSLDNGGNLIGVKVTKDGKPVTLTGTVTGYCILSDGQTVNVSGSGKSGIQNGNEAYIVLPQLVYSVPGQISIVIKLTKGTTTTTLAACTGYVYRSRTSNEVVPPGTHIPSLAELEDVVRRAEGIENVNIAQTKTDDILKFTVTDRNGNQTTTVVREPTAKVTKETGGPYVLTVRDGQGTEEDSKGYKYGETVATIPDVAAEVVDKAYVEAVTDPRVALGNPIRVDDAVKAPLDKMTIKLEPKQDLHGYDHPWVGGAGKNLLVYPYYNTTITINGLTFTDNGDGSITINGTSTAQTDFTLKRTSMDMPLENKDYIFSFKVVSESELPSSGFYIHPCANEDDAYNNIAANVEKTFTVTGGTFYHATIRVTADRTFVNTVCYPMLRDASDPDSTWVPYTNICPISGYDIVNVTRAGKNMIELPATQTIKGLTFTKEEDGSLTIEGTATANTTYYLNRVESSKHGHIILSMIGNVTVSEGDGGLYAKEADAAGTGSLNRYLTAETNEFSVFAANGFGNVWFYFGSGTVIEKSNVKIMARYDTENDTFIEGHNDIYPISLSVAGGTVYGGELTLNRDGSGTVVVDKAMVTLDGTESNIFISSHGHIVVRDNKLNVFSDAIFNGQEHISSLYVSDMTSSVTALPNGRSQLNNNRYSSTKGFMVHVDGVTTDAEAVAWFTAHPVQVCASITPVTHNLTAEQVQMLNGINHLSIDVQGKTEIIYRTDKYADKTDFLATLPRLTASGNPITLTNGADGIPLNRLSIRLDPKQSGSGAPSPTNIRPISGLNLVTVRRSEKNLASPYAWENRSQAGIRSQVQSDGTIHFTGTASSSFRYNSAYSGITLPAGTYVISGDPLDMRVSLHPANSDRIDTGGVFTVDGNTPVFIYVVVANGTSYDVYQKVQIESGSVVTAYEPYNGDEFHILFPASVGTVYGATLVLEQDGSGTLTIDTRRVSYSGSESWGTVNEGYRCALPEKGVSYSTKNISNYLYANTDPSAEDVTHTTEPAFNVGSYVNVGNFSGSLTALKEWLAEKNNEGYPLEIVYELLTPKTYQLTAPQVTTLLGYNVIYGDGEMEIEYYADPKMYIDGAVPADVSKAIAETERGTVATANHPVGDVFILNGRLCEATSAIAIGETLVPYTNYKYTSVENHFAPRKTPQFVGSIAISDVAGDVSLSRSKLQELVWIAGLVGNGTITETGDITSYPTTLQPYASASLGWVVITLPDNAIAPADLSMDSSLFSVSGRATGVSVNGAFHYSCSFSRNRKIVSATLTVTNDTNRVLNVTISPGAKISVTVNYKTFN